MQIQAQGGAITNQTLGALQLVSNSVFPTQGNQWFVAPRTGSDVNNSGTTPTSPFKTLATALSMATANQNDTIYLLAQSNTASQTTDYQSSTLTWNKDGVHLIGVNCGPSIGQRSRISNLSTAAAMAPMVNVTANGCLFQNLEMFQGAAGSGTTSICLQVTGQRNHFLNCQIAGIGDTTIDVSGSRSLKLSGSENLFERCTIGLTTVIRATAVEEVEISAGARNTFLDCDFETYTSLSTFKMISVATGCDRYIKLYNCKHVAIQNITSAVAPTGLIGITTMNGQVMVKDNYLYGFAQYVTADNAYVQMLGLDGLATGHLVGIAQGVDAA